MTNRKEELVVDRSPNKRMGRKIKHDNYHINKKSEWVDSDSIHVYHEASNFVLDGSVNNIWSIHRQYFIDASGIDTGYVEDRQDTVELDILFRDGRVCND